MAESTGTGGYTSGTASTICAISPSDLVGTIDNLITRIEKLESVVQQVLGANLHAETLSELSQQVGWVYGVEYMGVEGWIQTEYGTLIPPPGFTIANGGLTLSDGSTYQAVVMDENGVLQFGFGQTASDGTFTPVTGALPTAWSAAIGGVQDYCNIVRSPGFGVNLSTVRGMTLSSTALSPQGRIVVQVSQAGLYHFHGTLTLTTTATATKTTTTLFSSEDAASVWEGITPITTGVGIETVTTNISRVFLLASGTSTVTFQTGVLAGGSSVYTIALSGARISA